MTGRPPPVKPTNLAFRDNQNNVEGNLMYTNINANANSWRHDTPPLSIKTTPIYDDYDISTAVLGLGINGKVVECTNKKTGVKYALKGMFMLMFQYVIY